MIYLDNGTALEDSTPAVQTAEKDVQSTRPSLTILPSVEAVMAKTILSKALALFFLTLLISNSILACAERAFCSVV
jgi:hypothetical protein